MLRIFKCFIFLLNDGYINYFLVRQVKVFYGIVFVSVIEAQDMDYTNRNDMVVGLKNNFFH